MPTLDQLAADFDAFKAETRMRLDKLDGGDTTAPAPVLVEPTWTVLPAPTGKVVYVANYGKDTNPGTESAPVRTLGKAVNLKAQRVLLKCGDVFIGGAVKMEGTADAPAAILSYGTGPRPRVVSKGDTALHLRFCKHLLVSGIDVSTAPADRLPVAVRILSSSDVTLEDCCFHGSHINVELSTQAGQRNRNIVIRGCLNLDAYNEVSAARSQGVFADNTDGLTIEDGVFDHNGWKAGQKMLAPPDGNWDIYADGTCTGVIIRRNVFARPCAGAIKCESGGVVSHNLMLNVPIGAVVEGPTGTVQRNVVIGSQRLAGDATYNEQQYGTTRGWGITLGFAAGVSQRNYIGGPGMIRPLVVAKVKVNGAPSTMTGAIDVSGNMTPSPIIIERQLVGATIGSNTTTASTTAVMDVNGFMAGARQQRAGAWNTGYAAGSVRPTGVLRTWLWCDLSDHVQVNLAKTPLIEG